MGPSGGVKKATDDDKRHTGTSFVLSPLRLALTRAPRLLTPSPASNRAITPAG